MQKQKFFGILGCFMLVFALGLSGCDNVADPLSSDAALTAISVNGVNAVSLGTPSADWGTVVAGYVVMPSDKVVNAPVAVTKAADDAIVYYNASKAGQVPEFVEESTFTFEYGDSLWVEVFSGNYDAVLIYKIDIRGQSPIINDITLNGRSATGGQHLSGIPYPQVGTGVGTPNASYSDAVAGEVWFGTEEANIAQPLTVAAEEGTAFGYAVTDDAATVPTTFTPGSDTMSITPVDGKYLVLKANVPDAPNGGDTLYYKIKLVAKSADLRLKKVTIGGQTMFDDDGTIAQSIMGTHSFPGSEGYGEYFNGAELQGFSRPGPQGPNGMAAYSSDLGTALTGGSVWSPTALSALGSVAVAAEAVSSSLDIKFGHTKIERDYGVTYDTANGGTLTDLIADEYIAIEVTSELGEKAWYKFWVHVPAINLTATVGGSQVTLGQTKVRQSTFGPSIGQYSATPEVLVSDLTSIAVNATKVTGFENATVEYGIAGSGWTGPTLPTVWTSTDPLTNVQSGATIMIRVTDTDKIAGNPYFEGQQYYSVIVRKTLTAEDVRLTALQIGEYPGYGNGVPVTNLGTPNAALSSVVAGVVTLTTAQATTETMTATPALGPNICFTVPEGVTGRVAETSGADPIEEDWREVTQGGTTYPQMIFADNDILWVECKATISDTEYVNYYKITVTVSDE
ncbi:MAG: hypothetical protein LBQ88_07395 [Treponema sp.]|nr:hypothetical protein [Treponema sp.]